MYPELFQSLKEIPKTTSSIVSLIINYFFGVLFLFFYRYPVPFLGYIGPYEGKAVSLFDAISYALTSWLIYGFLGFFYVMPLILIFATYIWSLVLGKQPQFLVYITSAILVAFLCSVSLVALDSIIGPW